jgi:hypothetical protein
MKTRSIHFIIIVFIFASTSCHPNRLKTSEKELAKEIIIQEIEAKEAESFTTEKQKSDKPANSNSGIRYKEDRSVDPKKLPIRIDLPVTGNNTRKFRLSDVASSIRYIKLQTPPDTSMLYDNFYYRNDLMSTIASDGEQIIFQGLYGIARFSMSGEFKETIWKNTTGIEFYGGNPMWRFENFIGIMPNNQVSLFENNVYFDFSDGPAGNDLVMKYKPEQDKNISFNPYPEIPKTGSPPGDTLIQRNLLQLGGFENVYGIGPDMWAGLNSKWTSGKTGSLLVSFNNKGDTLCNFTDYDRIVNFSFGQYRRPVELNSYYYDGLLTIKPEYNDTAFRMIPPNRLLPAYIIDFGEFNVNFMEGLNPDLDLSGKYMLNSLHETDNFLFIRYTKNQDSPNNERKRAVKFYNVLFDKKQGKLFQQPGFTLLPEGIINDLDGGMPFWPEFITPQGEMMKLASGKNIKDYLNSESFTKGPATSDQRRKQISLANGLKDRDMIIIIIK